MMASGTQDLFDAARNSSEYSVESEAAKSSIRSRLPSCPSPPPRGEISDNPFFPTDPAFEAWLNQSYRTSMVKRKMAAMKAKRKRRRFKIQQRYIQAGVVKGIELGVKAALEQSKNKSGLEGSQDSAPISRPASPATTKTSIQGIASASDSGIQSQLTPRKIK